MDQPANALITHSIKIHRHASPALIQAIFPNLDRSIDPAPLWPAALNGDTLATPIKHGGTGLGGAGQVGRAGEAQGWGFEGVFEGARAEPDGGEGECCAIG